MLLILVCCVFSSVFGAPGNLDLSFANGGLYVEEFAEADDTAATVITDDEKILTVRTKLENMIGDFSQVTVVSFSKLFPNGTKDAAFGSVFVENNDGRISYEPTVAGLFPGGNFFTAGTLRFNASLFYWIGVFNQNTGLPAPGFGFNGHRWIEVAETAGNPYIKSASFDEMGLLLVGTAAPALYDQVLSIRVDVAGNTVSSWGDNGVKMLNNTQLLPQEGVCAFALQNGTTIIIGNNNREDTRTSVFASIISSTGEFLADATIRFSHPTSFDESKNRSVVTSCVRATTGGIILAGYAPGDFWAVARLMPGSVELDPEFGTGGLVVHPNISTSAFSQWHVESRVSPTGSIILAGSTGALFPFRTISTRLLVDGAFDPSWDSSFEGFGGAQRINSLQMQNNGKLLLSGQYYNPALEAVTFREEADPAAVPCEAGPQCFCVGANCGTQGDYIAPPSGPNINGTVFINGNLVSSNGTISIRPFPYGSGIINVGGVIYGGGTVVITVNQSGTYQIVGASGGQDGDLNAVVSTDDLQECEVGTADLQSGQGGTLSVTVTVARAPGCLTTGETIGVVFAAVAVGVLLAVFIIVVHRIKQRRFTQRRNMEFRGAEMDELKPNPQFNKRDSY